MLEMILVFFIASLVIVAMFVLIAIIVVSRRQKTARRQITLPGEIGYVDTQLEPEGTILVHSDLWQARSREGLVIAPHSQVRVVGIQDHVVLVEICG